MTYQRKTPAKGDPERTARDLEWSHLRDQLDAAYDARTEALEKRDSKGRYTKAWEAADRKFQKLDDCYHALKTATDQLSKDQRLAYLEDLACGTDVGQSIAARMNIHSEFGGPKVEGGYDQLLAFCCECVRQLGADEEAVSWVASQAASMIFSYPTFEKSTLSHCELQLKIYLRQRDPKQPLLLHHNATLPVGKNGWHIQKCYVMETSLVTIPERALYAEIDGLDLSEAERRECRDKLRRHEYDLTRQKEAVVEARQRHERNLKRKADVDAFILRKSAGHQSSDALTARLKSFSYDEVTRSNRLPLDIDEAQASIKRLRDAGKVRFVVGVKSRILKPVTV